MIVRRLFFRETRQLIKADKVLVQPLTIRTRSGHPLLDFFVADDATFFRVHQEHAARLQAALFQDSLRRYVEHANLRSHNHQIVFGDVVPGRA